MTAGEPAILVSGTADAGAVADRAVTVGEPEILVPEIAEACAMMAR